MVKSQGGMNEDGTPKPNWKMAYIHVMLRTYAECKDEIKALNHSYDSPNFPQA